MSLHEFISPLGQLSFSVGLNIFVVSLVALISGSFFGMLTTRLPSLMEANFWDTLKALSIEPSHCDKCDTKLNWYQLLPLISWLWQRGKCQHCQQTISPRYLVIELLTLAFALSVLWHFRHQHWSSGVSWWLCGSFLICIAVIDAACQLIPDKLSLPLLWLGLIINLFEVHTSLPEALLGAVVGYLSLWLIYQVHFLLTKRQGLGHGDFKLLAALGAWFGILQLPMLVSIAASTAVLYAAVCWLYGKLIRKQDAAVTPFSQLQLAFGPFLCLSAWFIMLMG